MVKKPGEEIFRMAVKRFQALYPEFDCVVCYNNCQPEQERMLRSMGIDSYVQRETDLRYPIMQAHDPEGWLGAAPGWGWKLCPPRLRPRGHELFVDNDLLIRERLPEIDKWLASDKFLIAQSHRDDPKYYGDFPVPAGTKCCAGLFGLPPNFNFSEEIIRRCKRTLSGKPLGHWGEQGLVTSTVLSNPHIIVKSVVNVKVPPEKPLPLALHFIAANRLDRHDCWEKFRDDALLTMV
jgi:hypothetical protein